MHIEIVIPRPYLTLALVAATAGSLVWMGDGGSLQAANGLHISPTAGMTEKSVDASLATSPQSSASVTNDARGGDDRPAPLKAKDAEDGMMRVRARQALRDRQEEILRYQLKSLEDESGALGSNGDPGKIDELRSATVQLTALMQDRVKAEQEYLGYLNQIWDAEGRATTLGKTLGGTASKPLQLAWPVDPRRGITAAFHDVAYKKFFGFEHNAIDIRAAQSTLVRAGADGIVKDVVDNGFGFSYITVWHEGGAVTLYGHLTKFLVQSGDRVHAGDPIAYSGGMPGTKGAGTSTGPHLHFGLFINGVATDPMDYLPVDQMQNTSDTSFQ